MRVLDFSPQRAEEIRQFESVGASAVALGHGAGEAHVWCVRFAPGGRIGPHPAGFSQLFLVVAGEGWAAGAEGRRVALACGHAAFFERGEVHSKGSDAGMTAVMVQADRLDPAAPDVTPTRPAPE